MEKKFPKINSIQSFDKLELNLRMLERNEIRVDGRREKEKRERGSWTTSLARLRVTLGCILWLRSHAGQCTLTGQSAE